MSPSSPQSATRPSAKASSVPAVVRTIAGMRKHEYPSDFCSNNTLSSMNGCDAGWPL